MGLPTSFGSSKRWQGEGEHYKNSARGRGRGQGKRGPSERDASGTNNMPLGERKTRDTAGSEVSGAAGGEADADARATEAGDDTMHTGTKQSTLPINLPASLPPKPQMPQMLQQQQRGHQQGRGGGQRSNNEGGGFYKASFVENPWAKLEQKMGIAS